MDLLLRRDGTRWTSRGEEFDYRQYIECCGPLTDFGYTGGWPVLSLGLVSFAEDHGFNVLHMRPGPYLGEQEDSEFGGAYRARDDGKVWLGQWNEDWWERQEYLIWEAGNRGIRVEMDMTDLWRARNGLDGTVPHPWMPDYNVHGSDRLHGLGVGGQFNDRATQWFKRVVERFGRFGNVIWFDGTEANLMPGWDERSTVALRDMVRGFEAEFGYPTHMFGSNGNDEAKKQVDYILEHGNFPRKARYGRPNVWQEYNGTPPLTADQWMLHKCEPTESYMALWRGWRPMSVETVLEIVERWGTDDCSFLDHRELPADNAPGWGRPFEGPFRKRAAVDKASSRIWGTCGKDPIMSLQMLAFELQQDGEYADWNGDHVMVWNGAAFEEVHWVSFGNGCRVGSPYRGTWPFNGVLPPPVPKPVGCTAPAMDMDHGQTRIKLDCAGYWCDATPSVHGGEYCEAIGMGCMPGSDPCVSRLDCPPRPEGHPERLACETVFFGGDPLWRTDGTLVSNPSNRSQARCEGCEWIEVCRADGTLCTREQNP